MSDPKRWSETDDVNGDARHLVTTLSKVEPTAAMRESVWAKVAATLPAGPGSGGASDGSGGAGSGGAGSGGAGSGSAGGGGGATATALGTGAKLMTAAALTAGAVSLWILTRTNAPPVISPAPSATPTAIAIATATAPTEPAAAPVEPAASAVTVPTATATATSAATLAAPARSPAIVPKPTPSTASAAAGATLAADRLREEAEGVKRARQLLRDKKTDTALTELDRLARLFPNGPLEEEREVLTIEALVGSSSSAELGRRRADRFLAERPQSVHAARVRGLVAH